MKKRWWGILAAALLLAWISGGLSGNEASAKPLELKFASISAPAHVLNAKVHVPWIKQLEERHPGQIKVTLYPGASLGPAKQAYDVAVKGIADISYGWITFHPGRFPLSEVYTLPGVVPNQEAAQHLWDAYQKFLKPEWAKMKVLWLGVAPGYIFIMREKPVRTIGAVKGNRVGFMGSIAAKVISALGGVPVDVAAQDAYTALQRKTIDGYITTWSSSAANKLGEVARYYTNAGLFNSMFFCVMNMESYKSLPPEIRRTVDENSGQKTFQWVTNTYWDDEQHGRKLILEQAAGKAEVFDFSKGEVQKYRTLVKPVWDEWVKGTESKGLQGRKVLEALLGYGQ